MPISRRRFVKETGLAAAAGWIQRSRGVLGGSASAQGFASIAGVSCATSHQFTNWSRTIEFRPQLFCRPKTEEEVVAIVKDARARGMHVRTQGAGHSFAQLHATSDTLLTLDDLEGSLSTSGLRATVPAGIRLKDLIKELKKRGLGMKNLGSITEQSIAGAFSTGTHGSGLGFGALSTHVVGARIVDGNGDAHDLTEQDTEELSAARINIGALGIITKVTLDCVPSYQLDYAAYLTTFDEIVSNIDQLAAENDRIFVWWLLMSKNKRDTCILLTKNALGHPVSEVLKQPSERSIRRCTLLSKDLALLPGFLGKAPKKGFEQFVGCRDDYDKVLTIPLLPAYHRECEYAIPASRAAAALKAMREIVEEGDITLSLPMEIRHIAKDDILLSPSNSEPMCYIGASTLLNSTEVFERFEPLMKSLGGRPHWGKCYTLTQAEVEAMYSPTYKTFLKVRDKYDPKRIFTNTLLTQLFP